MKQQRIYDLFFIKTKSKLLFQPYTKQRNFFLQKKSFLRKRESRLSNQKQKEGFFFIPIKMDPTTSIRMYSYELKVKEKIVRTAIKQDLSPDLNPLDYTIWGILENKTNVTSHPNIGSLKSAVEEKGKKISE